MVDVKLTTREFYEQLVMDVNSVRDEKIEFRRDSRLLKRPQALRDEGELGQGKEFVSRSAERLRPHKDDDLLEPPLSINMVTPDFVQPPKQL